MGETQLRATHDHDAKLEEQIKLRMLERERKHQLADQEKYENKLKAHEEFSTFFQRHVLITHISLSKLKFKSQGSELRMPRFWMSTSVFVTMQSRKRSQSGSTSLPTASRSKISI
jgi:hypothetical protein